MKVAWDLDGTLDQNPALCDTMRDLKKRGHKNIVLTGHHSAVITKAEKREKKVQLAALGLKGVYDKLKVFPESSVAQDKARYCREHGVDICVDNSQKNLQLMPEGTTLLMPWRTMTS